MMLSVYMSCVTWTVILLTAIPPTHSFQHPLLSSSSPSVSLKSTLAHCGQQSSTAFQRPFSDVVSHETHFHGLSLTDSSRRLGQAVAIHARTSRRRFGALGLVAEAPQLKDVVLPPCKKLCPGCEPWICPLAPRESQITELSESSVRLEELRKEKALEAERARMEAVAAGVQNVRDEAELRRLMENGPEGLTTLIFWGGAWCRKCNALKPKFVSLSKILEEEYGSAAGGLQFIYADAKGVGASRPELPPSMALQEIAGIQSVPTFQCWRGGKVLRTYTAELEVKRVMPSVIRMVDECVSLTDEELLGSEEESAVEQGEEAGQSMKKKWDGFEWE